MIAAEALAALPDAPADPIGAMREVAELGVPDQDTPPFRIHPYRGKGDKIARASGARQATSTGRLRVVGKLVILENQATTWQAGQASPDRMDAAVNAYNRLAELTGVQSMIATPGQAAQAPGGAQGSGSAFGSLLSRPMTPTDRA